MTRHSMTYPTPFQFLAKAAFTLFLGAILSTQSHGQGQGQKPPAPEDSSFSFKVQPATPFSEVMAADKQAKDKFAARHIGLLEERYDLTNKASNAKMSGGRKAIQSGVRVKLHGDVTWEDLAGMAPAEIKEKNLFPYGFRPLTHVKHKVGGMVFPKNQIDEIKKSEQRDLERFDMAFDLPDHLTPEFPPPIFLSTHPQLGDVSQGKLLTIRNYFELFNGILTPVQIEGLRLLLTPFPQQQFNQTDDRKVLEASLGVSCLDCHANGHTNAAFHLNPDTRPQEARHRLDTVSLRGMFNQQIHGSKRSLRSIEDFTEFEQRTAYFDGDHVTAAKKGVNLPDRASQVAMMAQMQNMLDFPPSRVDAFGKLNAADATESEIRGQEIFYGKGRCFECHMAPAFLDHLMHDLELERFYNIETIADQTNIPDGPIKTFTLRGIKDSPPYHHDGRLLTLDDTVEFFNLVLSLGLTKAEKADLVAFLLCL